MTHTESVLPLLPLRRFGGSTLIITGMTASSLVAGFAAFFMWRFTANADWVVEFFHIPAALMMVWLAFIQVWLGYNATRSFAPEDLLHRGWALITASACFQLLGSALSQILGVSSPINPLAYEPAWKTSLPTLEHLGLTLGGTFRFALLCAGLQYAVKTYRKAGFRIRLKFVDWFVLTVMALYVARNVAGVIIAMRHGKNPSSWEMLGWPTDLLLTVLLAQGLLLFRYAQQMGTGIIGRCWKAFAIGLFLTAIGDVGEWAFNYGSLVPPWNVLTWYVWMPAAAAFACAPALQLEVICRAENDSERPPVSLVPVLH